MKLKSHVANVKHLLVMKISAENFIKLLLTVIRFIVISIILKNMYELIDEFEMNC